MKPVQKCVRLSEEAVCCIENYPGDNFSSKLENLVLDLDLRRKELAELDKQLCSKRGELHSLTERIRGYRALDARLEPLMAALLSLLGEHV